MATNVIGSREATFLLELGPYDSEDVQVLRFQATESLSKPFRLNTEIASRDGNLDFERIVGEKATLTMRGTGGDRSLHGIVARFQQAGRTGHHTYYQVEIVPRFWLLTLRVTSRIFQDKTVQQIVASVLSDAGLTDGQDFRFELSGSYPTRTYCVQYRESDFAFVSRLLEHEGIFYFFDHTEDGEVLVIGDSPSVHKNIDGDSDLRYSLPTGMTGGEEQVYDLVYAQRVCSGAFRQRDFCFEKPTQDLEAESKGSVHDDLEVYEYPGAYQEPDVGSSLAGIRLEEQQATRLQASSRSDCLRITAGRLFDLVEHPRDEFNQQYLITEVCHTGAHPQSLEEEIATGSEPRYFNSLTVIPASVPYRPTRATARPIVHGVQTAIVVGPEGKEIYTDEHGRVKVKFHWDLAEPRNEESSCWIRASQPWAGQGWGSVAIPRIGQEVIIEFLEGDPDRPILTGRVYNGDNAHPYKLPDNATQSGVKSRSSMDGTPDNFNEIRFEDKKGSEEVYIHAEKNQKIVVEADKTEDVGHDETITIGNDRTETVKHDETMTVDNDRTRTVKHNETLTVENDRTRTVKNNESITIENDRSRNVKNNETITIDNDRTETVKNNETLTVNGARTRNVSKNESITIGKDQKRLIGANRTATVAKNDTLNVGKVLTISAGNSIVIRTGKASITMKKDGTITIQGKDITLKASGKITEKAAKNLVMKAKKILGN